MSKKHFFAVMLFAAASMLFMTTFSYAVRSGQKPCPKLGYCAPGTCAEDGNTLACNPKNCKKSNCRK